MKKAPRSIWLSDSEWARYHTLGGTPWLSKLLVDPDAPTPLSPPIERRNMQPIVHIPLEAIERAARALCIHDPHRPADTLYQTWWADPVRHDEYMRVAEQALRAAGLRVVLLTLFQQLNAAPMPISKIETIKRRILRAARFPDEITASDDASDLI